MRLLAEMGSRDAYMLLAEATDEAATARALLVLVCALSTGQTSGTKPAAILAALQKYPSSEAVQTIGCDALRRAAAVARAASNTLGEMPPLLEGIPAALVAALRRFPRTPMILKDAGDALEAAVSESKSAAEEAITAGMVELALNTLQAVACAPPQPQPAALLRPCTIGESHRASAEVHVMLLSALARQSLATVHERLAAFPGAGVLLASLFAHCAREWAVPCACRPGSTCAAFPACSRAHTVPRQHTLGVALSLFTGCGGGRVGDPLGCMQAHGAAFTRAGGVAAVLDILEAALDAGLDLSDRLDVQMLPALLSAVVEHSPSRAKAQAAHAGRAGAALLRVIALPDPTAAPEGDAAAVAHARQQAQSTRSEALAALVNGVPPADVGRLLCDESTFGAVLKVLVAHLSGPGGVVGAWPGAAEGEARREIRIRAFDLSRCCKALAAGLTTAYSQPDGVAVPLIAKLVFSNAFPLVSAWVVAAPPPTTPWEVEVVSDAVVLLNTVVKATSVWNLSDGRDETLRAGVAGLCYFLDGRSAMANPANPAANTAKTQLQGLVTALWLLAALLPAPADSELSRTPALNAQLLLALGEAAAHECAAVAVAAESALAALNKGGAAGACERDGQRSGVRCAGEGGRCCTGSGREAATPAATAVGRGGGGSRRCGRGCGGCAHRRGGGGEGGGAGVGGGWAEEEESAEGAGGFCCCGAGSGACVRGQQQQRSQSGAGGTARGGTPNGAKSSHSHRSSSSTRASSSSSTCSTYPSCSGHACAPDTAPRGFAVRAPWHRAGGGLGCQRWDAGPRCGCQLKR